MVSGALDFAMGTGSGSANFSGDFDDGGPSGTVALTWEVSQTDAIECPEPEVSLLASAALLMIVGLRAKGRRSQTTR